MMFDTPVASAVEFVAEIGISIKQAGLNLLQVLQTYPLFSDF